MARIQKWEYFSKNQLMQMIQNSNSLREFGQKMGYSYGGGHTAVAAQRAIEARGLQKYAEHFFDKDDQDLLHPEVAAAAVLKQESFTSNISDATYKKVLIKDRGYRCECCGTSEWNGVPVPLQLHHKDGNHTNNKLDNLELLCANCHVLTENYGGKNKKSKSTATTSSSSSKKNHIPDDVYANAIVTSPNATEALKALGLNYRSAHQFRKLKEIKTKYKIDYKPMQQ